jgi:hypothetical protein
MSRGVFCRVKIRNIPIHKSVLLSKTDWPYKYRRKRKDYRTLQTKQMKCLAGARLDAWPSAASPNKSSTPVLEGTVHFYKGKEREGKWMLLPMWEQEKLHHHHPTSGSGQARRQRGSEARVERTSPSTRRVTQPVGA